MPLRTTLLTILAVGPGATCLLPAATPRVEIRTQAEYRLMLSNGLPNHETGRFPNRNNPNPIAEMSHIFRMPLRPRVAPRPTPTGFAWFGVALNGVPFEPGTQEFWKDDRESGWNYEAMGGSSDLGIDLSLAHVQPNGAYHYHGSPKALLPLLGDEGKEMVLIGWAADGFPIYGGRGNRDPADPKSGLKEMRPSYRLKAGLRPGEPKGPGGRHDGNFTEDYEYVAGLGDLDECNGRFGVTPEFPRGTYHYHATAAFPYVSRFWKGVADITFQKQGPPAGSHPRKPRRPDDPRGEGP
ncbi:MAG: YHYH protein [Verrucomicrobiota bacterium]